MQQAKGILPGVSLCLLIAMLSARLSLFIGERMLGYSPSPVSPGMIALLLGIVLGNLPKIPAAINAGVSFSAKRILRLGVVLIGIRMSVYEVIAIGMVALPLVVVCVAGALIIVLHLSRRIQISPALGTLIAVGTSICGVSAILATAPTIEASDEETSYAVACITLFGMIALLVYPFLVNVVFSGDQLGIGLFLGTAIHDTSQVTGAALLYSEMNEAPLVLDVATVTKLVRNVLMAVVIPLVAIRYRRQYPIPRATESGTRTEIFPRFVMGFIGLSIVRSFGDATLSSHGAAFGLISPVMWETTIRVLSRTAVFLFSVALTAVGIKTPLKRLIRLGPRPFFVSFAAAIVVGILSVTTMFLAKAIL